MTIADCYESNCTEIPIVADRLEDSRVFFWEFYHLILILCPTVVLEESLEELALHKFFVDVEYFLFTTDNDFDELGTIRTKASQKTITPSND